MNNMIIPVQSEENASEAIHTATIKKIKRIKKQESSEGTDLVASTTVPDEGISTPPLISSTKTARKTFSKYSITLKSISCLANILAQVAEFYPIESFRYFNNFRYKQLNSKTSDCECTFHSHLTAEELADIFRQNRDEYIREAVHSLHILRSTGKKKGQEDDSDSV